MRFCLALVLVSLFGCAAYSQQSPAIANASATKPSDSAAKEAEPSSGASPSPESQLKDLFEAKIKAEWDALKSRDKKTYGEFLANDYEGVETDGRGERNRLQAIDEVSQLNFANYTLWGLKVTPLGPEATFLIYEITMQFPPRSVLPYSRVYISSLWVKRGTDWKELHYQETHVK
jgi:hypothetical protein